MTCVPANPTYRLLDAWVGWDPDSVTGLIGLSDPSGIRLAGDDRGVLDRDAVLRWLPPARIAAGCGPCETWLATEARGLLFRGPCTSGFEVVWEGPVPEDGVPELVAVASGGHRVAVLEASGQGWILLASTRQTLGRFKVPGGRLLAWNRRGELLVVRGDGDILRFGPDGDLRADPHRSPPPGRIVSIGEDDDERTWVLVARSGRHQLLFSDPPSGAWEPGTVARLAAELVDQRVPKSTAEGFCLEEPGDGEVVRTCWDWRGCPSRSRDLMAGGRGVRKGELTTVAIDSGIRRCEWHRLRARMQVPAGTTLQIEVASSEDPEATPHPRDWQRVEAAQDSRSVDALIRQPRGRYLYLRIEMTGTGTATPVLQQVRLDMPRVTSAVHLPAVYADDPKAFDFTRRFLALFDTQIDAMDAAIERMPALLDVGRAPGAVLPWIAALYDIDLDEGWTEEQRRALLEEAPALARRRGTPGGVLRTIELAFPSETWATHPPILRELGLERPWGGVGTTTQLGTVRLFGRSRARMRLGTSPLGGAPLKSFGNPGRDPLDSVSGRFEIVIPPLLGWDRDVLRERVQRLVDAIKPAHTVGVVRVGGAGFTVGSHASVGVDTVSAAPDPAVLGQNIRLGRTGVLGRGQPGPDWRVGRGIVGGHTVVE